MKLWIKCGKLSDYSIMMSQVGLSRYERKENQLYRVSFRALTYCIKLLAFLFLRFNLQYAKL
jgi:hypothetical protein